jgi:hypothetical protein
MLANKAAAKTTSSVLEAIRIDLKYNTKIKQYLPIREMISFNEEKLMVFMLR